MTAQPRGEAVDEVTREELHFRRIDFHGFRRSDGLFEVEARLTDRKTHDFKPPSGARMVPAGDAIHDHGLRVGPGWNSELRKRLPSGDTCTHLKEMMGPLATAAFQTMFSMRTGSVGDASAEGKPGKIDSCYAYGASRELVRLNWPAFHRPEPPAEPHGATAVKEKP